MISLEYIVHTVIDKNVLVGFTTQMFCLQFDTNITNLENISRFHCYHVLIF